MGGARHALLFGAVLVLAAMASMLWWGYAPSSRQAEESAALRQQDLAAPSRGDAEAAGSSDSSTPIAPERQLLSGANPAPALTPTRPTELAVTVRDGLGRPARGSLAGRGTEPGPWRDAVPLDTNSPVADGKGWLKLPAGLAVVHVWAEDCPAAVVTLGPEAFRTGRLDLQLRRTGALHLRLVDAQGLLLAHRQVEARLEVAVTDVAVGGSIAYQEILVGASDDRGDCQLLRLVEGRWHLVVPEHCEWRETTVGPVDVRPGEVADLEVVVPVLAATEFAGLRVATSLLPVALNLSYAPPPEQEWEVEVTPQRRLPLRRAGRGMARCIVVGEAGAVVEVALVHKGADGLRSEPIRLVVGAETEVTPLWQDR